MLPKRQMSLMTMPASARLKRFDVRVIRKSFGLHIRHSPKLAVSVPSIVYGSDEPGHSGVSKASRAIQLKRLD